MKNVTIHIGDSVIEIHNSWQGKETIIVDGQKVSEKNSMSGAYHSFTILDNGKEKLVELDLIEAKIQENSILQNF